MKSKELKEKRADLFNKIDELNGLAKTEARELTTAELDELDGWVEETERLNGEIERAEKREAVMAQAAARNLAANPKTPEAKVAEKFSLIEFINQVGQRKLSGVYQEMHQEAQREARASGVDITGFGVPHMILNQVAGQEVRDMTVGTTTDGGHAVDRATLGIVEWLSNKTVLGQLGADFMTDLVGSILWPREDAEVNAGWNTETGTATEVTPTLETVTLTPKRLTCFTDVSNQLLRQTSPSIDARVRTRLLGALARGIEVAAFNGTGANNQPTGILGTSGIGSVAMGTNGGDVTWAAAVNLYKALQLVNSDFGNLAYCTTPQVIAKMRTTLKDSSVGGYIMPEGTLLNGYPVYATNNMPSTLDKGSSSSSLSAMILGNWSDLVVGQWGGLDVLTNPYTKGKEGLTEIIATAYVDVACVRAKSFAAIQDITTS